MSTDKLIELAQGVIGAGEFDRNDACRVLDEMDKALRVWQDEDRGSEEASWVEVYGRQGDE